MIFDLIHSRPTARSPLVPWRTLARGSETNWPVRPAAIRWVGLWSLISGPILSVIVTRVVGLLTIHGDENYWLHRAFTKVLMTLERIGPWWFSYFCLPGRSNNRFLISSHRSSMLTAVCNDTWTRIHRWDLSYQSLLSFPISLFCLD